MDDLMETRVDEDEDLVAHPSGWSSLRWIPAMGCAFLGMTLVLIGLITAIKLGDLVRTRGWAPFTHGTLSPGVALASAGSGTLFLILAGVAGILASASWARFRWVRASLLTASLVVWILVGAFLFGQARVDL